MSDRPKWIIDAARDYYDRQGTASLETNIQSTTPLLSVLSEYVLPTFTPRDKFSILEVGIGQEAHLIRCPYEPYRIAGLLEYHGKDYQIALVDKNKEVLNDVERRRNLFLLQVGQDSYYSSEDIQAEDKAWNEYLSHTNQNERMTYYPTDQLYFAEWLKDHERTNFLARGVRSATIPKGFQRRLEKGQIPLVRGDIATTNINLRGQSPYNLIVTQFVFPYLRENGQKLALYNLAQAVREGGYIVVDELKMIMAWMNFFFKGQYGGWVTDKELGEIGLKDVFQYNYTNTYTIHVLRKQ